MAASTRCLPRLTQGAEGEVPAGEQAAAAAAALPDGARFALTAALGILAAATSVELGSALST